MTIKSACFKGHRCFKRVWSGFDEVKPINVIIGRNNTGKSHLLDLAEALCDGKLETKGWSFRFDCVLDELSLKRAFPENTSGGELQGNHWEQHGRFFVDVPVTWETDEKAVPTELVFPNGFEQKSPHGTKSSERRLATIGQLVRTARHQLFGSNFRRLFADRDIRPENPDIQLRLFADGRGATNIIRRYVVTSNPTFPREVIQRELLDALNEVFGSDGKFTEIEPKLHDDAPGKQSGEWEVFLGEAKKGLIPLSSSGSGLKTVFLVLLNLLVVPKIEKKQNSEFTFAFEELENNLHPALLRRLFQYLENYAVRERATIFLTTHSSTALDLFGVSKNAQIIHVTHDGEAARAVTVSAHFDHLGVISELGAKPSDLLQANGIIWVEGPSDCIYLNKWLDLYTGGRLQEGRDYQCAFYGGSLLARTQFTSPEIAEKELVNLFRVNPNIVVVCDGDRPAKGSRAKQRVRRIRSEVRKIPGAHIWVTAGREIENYLPGVVLAKALELTSLPDPAQYDLFFPRKGAPGTSYVETKANRKGIDKMELAVLSAAQMDKAMMVPRFDWDSEMKAIVERVDSWNR